MGDHALIQATYHVDIGELCEIGPGAYISSWDTITNRKGKVTLEPGSCVGANSTVLPKVTIGKNSIIGAGSVVPYGTEIPSNEVWAGVPVKKLRNLRKGERRVE